MAFWLAVAMMGSVSAFAADENVSGTSVQTDGTAQKAAPGAGVDDVIDNNYLRALSGSTSRWSIASQFNYNGGTIASPLSQDRPNIAAASATTDKSDLDGQISAKYNIDAKNSLMAGIGTRWIAPLSPGSLNGYAGTRFDAINPYLQYQHVYKWLGIQSVIQVQAMQYTQADAVAQGYAQQLNIDQENMYEVGKTGLSIGASTFIQGVRFNKSGSFGNPADPDNYVSDIRTLQSAYEISIEPELEYQISDKVNFRTLINLLTYEHYLSESNLLSFQHDKVYQSVGLGFSVTRDIFLYPNIQFLPAQMQAALTNIGLTATINLF